jgi:hypothetical protein
MDEAFARHVVPWVGSVLEGLHQCGFEIGRQVSSCSIGS